MIFAFDPSVSDMVLGANARASGSLFSICIFSVFLNPVALISMSVFSDCCSLTMPGTDIRPCSHVGPVNPVLRQLHTVTDVALLLIKHLPLFLHGLGWHSSEAKRKRKKENSCLQNIYGAIELII